MTIHFGRRWIFVLALVSTMSITGCGGKTKVTGKVTYNGKPVVWGSVTMVDSTGAYHSGDIDLSGNYSIDNVPSGPVKIAVNSPNPVDPRKGNAGGDKPAKANLDDPREKFLASQGGKETPKPLPPEGAWMKLPDSAGDPNTSGLSGTVKSGEALNIEVK
jgi:hypothetical protein